MASEKWNKLIAQAKVGDVNNIVKIDTVKYSDQQIARPVSDERVQEFLSIKDDAVFTLEKKMIKMLVICFALLVVVYNIKLKMYSPDKSDSADYYVENNETEMSSVGTNEATNSEEYMDSETTNDMINEEKTGSGITEDGMYEYELVGDVVTIKKYVGTETEVIIPEQIAGATKIKIGAAAFQDSNITSIDITKNVIEIADGHNFQAVFGNLTTLEKVHIAGGLKVLSAYSFHNCTGLKEVTIEEGLETIEEFAFHGCSNLTSMEIPSSVKKIANGGLGTSGIKSITVASDCIVEGTEGNGKNIALEINYE